MAVVQTRKGVVIPAIIHTIWCGERMPFEVWKSVWSVGERHADWSHIIWNEAMLGAIGFDVPALKEQLGSWASVTNWLRLRLLYRFDGFYLDADVECLRALDGLRETTDEALAAMQDGGRICNAVMAAVPAAPWVKWQIDHWQDFDQKDAASGVYLATAAPRDGLRLLEPRLVYPWLYDAPPEQRIPHADSLLVHHWLGTWTKK